MSEPVWNGRQYGEQEVVDEGIARLREDAIRIAREDAASGLPSPDRQEPSDSEFELRERCRAFVQRLRNTERKRVASEVGALEERVTETIPKIHLGLDRFERIKDDVVRLRMRREGRKQEITRELGREPRAKARARGVPTAVYIAAISFLGLVEFFANAPVFSSLLPRDPLTERQIRILAETSDGWFAGLERVVAHTLMRPDAALLAAGVITFLCVMGHFFGHSLRELVIHQDARSRRDTVASRSALESVVPMVITGVGLALVLGVLFEARVMLGDVGQERYEQDIAQVEELRRQAGWQRGQGELLEANGLTNRAEDMEAVALELREYSRSMSRMSFPILLLNLTLVLCSIAAAYFHRRDARTEKFNEDVFEEERVRLVEGAEKVAGDVGSLLAELTRDTRRLKSAVVEGTLFEWTSVVPQLEAVVALYRAENGRARSLDTHQIPAFRSPLTLALKLPDAHGHGNGTAHANGNGHPGWMSNGSGHANGNGNGGQVTLALRAPEEYENTRLALVARYEDLRTRFNEEVRK
jgi:hypothetical protein